MQDFKFSKFFGVSAPMAVLMGTGRFREITDGFHGYVGGKMLNSLKIELELFKHFVVDGLEFSKTVDINSEDYRNFVRGLQVFLGTKENSEMLPSAGVASYESGVKNSDRTDMFGSLAEGLTAVPEVDDAFAGIDALEDLPVEDSDELGDVFGDDPFGMDLVSAPVIINLVQMGKEYEGEPECSVKLNSHTKVILFLNSLGDKAESLGLNSQEVSVIQEQYAELPMVYTGRLQIKETGEVLDLEKKGDPMYHALKVLQQKATVLEDGVPIIDRLISIVQGAVEDSLVSTRKLLGQNFTSLCSSRGYTIETRMMESLAADSKEAKLNRINAYIQDCGELLSDRTNLKDRNLVSELGLKVSEIQTACEKLSMYPDLPEFQEESTKPKLVTFVKLCQECGQFSNVFSSLMATKRLFGLYCEVLSWTNEKWLAALDMMVTDDPDKAGSKMSTGYRELYMVAPNFNIDSYCEELLMKYNVIGATTRGILFYSDSLKIIGKISDSANYSLKDAGCSEQRPIVGKVLLQLLSMQRRLINPVPSFFAEV